MFKSIITLMSICLSFYSFSYVDSEVLNENNCKNLSSVDPQTGYTRTNNVFHFEGVEFDFLLQRKGTAYELTKISSGNIISKIMLKRDIRTVRDFISYNENFYLATSEGLLKFSHEGEFLENLLVSNLRGLERERNLLYLAAGRDGLIAFDLEVSKISFKNSLSATNDNGHRSASVALTKDKDSLFIAMTGSSEKGFNGVLTFNKNTKRISNKAEYNKRKVGVVFPYAQIYHRDENIYLNNGGWIHRIPKSDLVKNKKVNPKWLAIQYTGNTFRQYIMLKGDLIFQNQEILGCGNFFKEGQRSPSSKDFSYSF